MKITQPCKITSRRMPGIDVGNGTLSIEYVLKPSPYGRTNYRYFIDTRDGIKYENCDLSGLGNLQDGLTSLLSFLLAAAEAYRSTMSGRTSENEDLFPPESMEWAGENATEIEYALRELEAAHLIRE